MPETAVVAFAAVAGGFCAMALLAAFAVPPPGGSWPGVARLGSSAGAVKWRAVLQVAIERAGWKESPERLAVLSLSCGGCGAVIAGALDPLLAPVGLVAGAAVVPIALNRAIADRRARLAGELVPLLELFTLELSGGGSAFSALGSVTVQVDSELANELRRMLIAAQVTGSASVESRLIEYSQRSGIPALASLATVLAASREFGTGASAGVRALAIDLRRAQRRELITHSRRALNHVLLPAAVGVLLPFLGVLMFPAVTVLQRSLR